MGFAKLNVWVRYVDCQVINRVFHLHIYDCHGRLIMPYQWCSNGHGEIQVPPGCYILQAGVNAPGGNYYTDRAMVIVGCGDEACVNLVLPKFLAENPPPLAQQPLMLYYCPVAMMNALVYNAQKEGVDLKELDRTVDVLAKASKMDKSVLLEAAKAEIRIIEEGKAQMKGKELEELTEHITLLNSFLRSRT